MKNMTYDNSYDSLITSKLKKFSSEERKHQKPFVSKQPARFIKKAMKPEKPKNNRVIV
jgi:hypothetical protein